MTPRPETQPAPMNSEVAPPIIHASSPLIETSTDQHPIEEASNVVPSANRVSKCKRLSSPTPSGNPLPWHHRPETQPAPMNSEVAPPIIHASSPLIETSTDQHPIEEAGNVVPSANRVSKRKRLSSPTPSGDQIQCSSNRKSSPVASAPEDLSVGTSKKKPNSPDAIGTSPAPSKQTRRSGPKLLNFDPGYLERLSKKAITASEACQPSPTPRRSPPAPMVPLITPRSPPPQYTETPVTAPQANAIYKPNTESLNASYVHETQIIFLLRLAATRAGGAKSIEAKILAQL
ncbi:uncharacterized protein MELLADRAFT_109479 [Melampsora larici-populina 98AG31]|uniref:Uncharacterized protein n=1 Tax=Melampsora larici-populina (strain 98AG31 / pathotype 3-4-7) TaxID=747676 RepID=F4RWL9_MELLP|nr:uncharacterized protein MELLADRAFT_109479 [Melampsora larici-populina 98AG31]EGG03210.1 hypothetical protein MELLADRAFT_109479 [Melampsora larici-populina 98AG31]